MLLISATHGVNGHVGAAAQGEKLVSPGPSKGCQTPLIFGNTHACSDHTSPFWCSGMNCGTGHREGGKATDSSFVL